MTILTHRFGLRWHRPDVGKGCWDFSMTNGDLPAGNLIKNYGKIHHFLAG
jgi:hypothetical protein